MKTSSSETEHWSYCEENCGYEEDRAAHSGEYTYTVNEDGTHSKFAACCGAYAGSQNYAAYTSAAAMKSDTAAQTELATWDTAYRTIVEGVPTWNKK